MSYKALYDYCQTLKAPIGRNDILPKVRELSGEGLTYIRAGLDQDILLGFFVSATNEEHQFVQKTGGGNVIVIARGLERPWERFVLFKEAMHVFDPPLQWTNTEADLEALLTDFCAAEIPGEPSQQFISENACLWMAIGALCPEKTRVNLQQERDGGKLTDADIAKFLKVPEKYVPAFFNHRIKEIMAWLTVGV